MCHSCPKVVKYVHHAIRLVNRDGLRSSTDVLDGLYACRHCVCWSLVCGYSPGQSIRLCFKRLVASDRTGCEVMDQSGRREVLANEMRWMVWLVEKSRTTAGGKRQATREAYELRLVPQVFPSSRPGSRSWVWNICNLFGAGEKSGPRQRLTLGFGPNWHTGSGSSAAG